MIVLYSYFYILSETRMLRNDYFHGFFFKTIVCISSSKASYWINDFYRSLFVNEFLIVFGQNLMTRINPWSPETYWCFVRFSFLNFDWCFHNSCWLFIWWLEFDVEDFCRSSFLSSYNFFLNQSLVNQRLLHNVRLKALSLVYLKMTEN